MSKEAINISALVNATFYPTDMLVVYRNEKANLTEDTRGYVEHHNIDKDGKPGAAKPLTEQLLRNISIAVADKRAMQSASLRHLLPENILLHDSRIGRHILAWYEPPQVQVIKMAQGKVKTYTIPFPALLYVAKDRDIHIYALKTGRKRPQLNTPVFKAPCFNIYADSSVCMGDIITKTDGVEDIMELKTRWLKAFWSGKFTHELEQNPCRTNLTKLYNSLRKKRIFPIRELLPAQLKTIRQILTSL